MIEAYDNIVQKMKAGGLGIKLHILDDEISAEYKAAIKSNGATHQLVPPGDHRRNMAKRAIQPFKDNLIGVLAGLHNTFPMHLWCRLVAPAEMQLNLLRQSNITPKISAYAHLHGHHNFMKQPLAPLGCPVLAHKKPDKRGTWSDHAINAWNLGTSMEHHRCFKIYSKTTRAERIADTVFFKHKYLTTPTTTPEDAVVAAAQQLAQAIGGNSKGGNKVMAALQEAAKLFENIAQENKENSKPTSNGVTHQSATVPRVPTRAQKTKESTRLVVACPSVAVIESKWHPFPSLNIPKYKGYTPESIFQEQKEVPAHNTRSRKELPRSITQETVLSAMEMSNTNVTARNLAARKFPMQLLCELAGAVMDANGELLQYRHLIKRPEYREVWGKAYGKELGRLAQGMLGVVEGTDTLDFIRKDEIPADRRKDVTYGQIVCNYRPEKDDPNRARLVVGGDRINYPGKVGTPTCSMLTVKLLLNSIVSTPGAKFFTMDIKNFYLMTPLKRREYVRLNMSDMPADVIEHYKLQENATPEGSIFVSIKRGMYGLPQSGLLAQELLEERLGKRGYYQSQYTPGLWLHKTRPITFTLCVDDFGVKYVREEDKAHLA